MDEKRIERQLRREVERRGGRALKFASPGLSGVPDRLILMPGERVCFVETKAPGKRPRILQAKRARELAEFGFTVHNVSTPEELARFLEGLTADEV